MAWAPVAEADCGDSAMHDIDMKRKWHDSSEAKLGNLKGQITQQFNNS